MKRLGVFLFPLDGMLVYCRVTPPALNSSVPIYTPGWKGTVRVKCLDEKTQHHDPGQGSDEAVRSGDERTNHEATAAPIQMRSTTKLVLFHTKIVRFVNAKQEL